MFVPDRSPMVRRIPPSVRRPGVVAGGSRPPDPRLPRVRRRRECCGRASPATILPDTQPLNPLGPPAPPAGGPLFLHRFFTFFSLLVCWKFMYINPWQSHSQNTRSLPPRGTAAMSATEVICRSCQRTWAWALASTVYAQQALESCPCPYCGAYTLSCVDAQVETSGFKQSRSEGQRAAARADLPAYLARAVGHPLPEAAPRRAVGTPDGVAP
jgi:hypothetical protein